MSTTPPDRIRLLLPELPCRIGVLPGETDAPQSVRVTLEIAADLGAAARSGELNDTVDYAALHAEAVRLVTARTWDLVERLAGDLARAALTREAVRSVRVVVRKCAPPLGDGAGPVEIELFREAAQ